MMKNYNHFCS